ncbi:hypothetical protein GE09DRAFT_1220532 [Coniochaeta sp. 2T2.1]|nr:hypothetical protein GE09DRAFT_1220532 [Coniochaeta sp. 2T2.1]
MSWYTPATPRDYEPDSPAVAALLAVYSRLRVQDDSLPERKGVGDENKKPTSDGKAGNKESADNKKNDSEGGNSKTTGNNPSENKTVKTEVGMTKIGDMESTNSKAEATEDGITVTGTESADTEATNSEAPKPKHRRVARLKLKANIAPASSDGLRRFALRANHVANAMHTFPNGYKVPCVGLTYKLRPMLYASNHIHDWRDFRLERTPAAMNALEAESIPFQSLPHLLSLIHSALASTSTSRQDAYLVLRHITRHLMSTEIDPARHDGLIPKTARFTHFVPSNLLVIKLPLDAASKIGHLDMIAKPIIGWAHSLRMARELKVSGHTRYIAKIRASAVEGVDFDQPHPALERIAEANRSVLVDGFGSFNESDMGFRPWRCRPYKFDTPTVVVESNFGSTDNGVLRYKACWWLELMEGEVRAVVLVNVDPDEQEIRIEVWRNERMTEGDENERLEGLPVGAVVPTRVQEVVITKKEEFKGVREDSDHRHYKVEGGPLRIGFVDFFLEEPSSEFLRGKFPGREDEDWDFELGDEWLAMEAADLWYADGMLVNDWREGLVDDDDEGGESARPV